MLSPTIPQYHGSLDVGFSVNCHEDPDTSTHWVGSPSGEPELQDCVGDMWRLTLYGVTPPDHEMVNVTLPPGAIVLGLSEMPALSVEAIVDVEDEEVEDDVVDVVVDVVDLDDVVVELVVDVVDLEEVVDVVEEVVDVVEVDVLVLEDVVEVEDVLVDVVESDVLVLVEVVEEVVDVVEVEVDVVLVVVRGLTVTYTVPESELWWDGLVVSVM